MREKILIVDDDRNICEILEFNFINEGFDVECSYSAEEAMEKLTDDFALILLDVMMSGMSGYKMAKKLRSGGNQIPVIFLTAKDTENDKLTGFSVGGDDYISKPFSVKEVIARIKAVLKRQQSLPQKDDAKSNVIVVENMLIDLQAKELHIDGKKVKLTKTEFEILSLLAQKPETTYTRENIIDRVWNETMTTYVIERNVDVHIAHLRKKMGKYASLIANRHGYGYQLNLKLHDD